MSQTPNEFRRAARDEARRRSEVVERIVEEVEARRADARTSELSFTGVTADQLWSRIDRSNSPFITSQGWTSSSASPGEINYTLGISNPDPVAAIWLFAHVYVGPGTVAQTVDGALAAVDVRFSRLTEPAFDGLTIAPGGSATLSFVVRVPMDVQPSNYLGNAVLFASTWHDPSTYLDRSVFVFQVT